MYNPDDASNQNFLYGDTYNRFVAFFFIAIVLVCGVVLTNVVRADEHLCVCVRAAIVASIA